jgi:Ribbon-helix-helix protein, copG family
MTFTIRLDPETEAAIARLARRGKRTKSAVVREAIAAYQRTQDSAAGKSRTVFEAMAPFIGIADSGGSRRSEETGAAFRAVIAEKARARGSR